MWDKKLPLVAALIVVILASIALWTWQSRSHSVEVGGPGAVPPPSPGGPPPR
jgi:hypothetical protein